MSGRRNDRIYEASAISWQFVWQYCTPCDHFQSMIFTREQYAIVSLRTIIVVVCKTFSSKEGSYLCQEAWAVFDGATESSAALCGEVSHTRNKIT